MYFLTGRGEREEGSVKKCRDDQSGEGKSGTHPGFRGRLQRIASWEPLVIQSCYSGAALARLCGVSLRHLQRHIHAAHGRTLGGWLNVLRLKHGYQRLAQGCSVKETAFSLGYKQVSHFSRSFKNYFDYNPSEVPITIGTAGLPVLPTAPEFALQAPPTIITLCPCSPDLIPD